MTQTEVRRFTSWLGKRSYKARVKRERIQEIAWAWRGFKRSPVNGKKGGRPKGSGKKHTHRRKRAEASS